MSEQCQQTSPHEAHTWLVHGGENPGAKRCNGVVGLVVTARDTAGETREALEARARAERFVAKIEGPEDYIHAPAIATARNTLADALSAEREAREEAERESAWQMGSKLEAQMALAAITKALDLRLADLGNGWTEGVKVILARIETTVDEAERGFHERDTAEARVAALEEALRELSLVPSAGPFPHKAACRAFAEYVIGVARAALGGGTSTGGDPAGSPVAEKRRDG